MYESIIYKILFKTHEDYVYKMYGFTMKNSYKKIREKYRYLCLLLCSNREKNICKSINIYFDSV